MQNFGIVDACTDNSLRESAMKVDMLVKRAKDLGMEAIALTDNGVMTGFLDFIAECEHNGIKPVTGATFYVDKKALVVLAKDYQGYVAICKAMSYANLPEHLDIMPEYKNGSKKKYPQLTEDILVKYFGKGSSGYGHVIMHSANVYGVLGALFTNQASKKISNLMELQKKYTDPNSTSYLLNKERFDKLNEAKANIAESIKNYKSIANKSTRALESKLAKAKEKGNEELIASLTEELQQKANEKVDAAAKLGELTTEKERTDIQISTLSAIVKRADTEVKGWMRLQEQIDELKKECLSGDELIKAATKKALWYKNTFSDFYISLQYHGCDTLDETEIAVLERNIMPKLAEIAKENDIPVVLSNEAYMPTNSQDDILARAIIQTLGEKEGPSDDYKWHKPSSSEKEYYVKSADELISKISEIIPESIVLDGYYNIKNILDQCNMKMPVDAKFYPSFKTPDGSTAAEYLTKRTWEGAKEKYPELTDAIKSRIEYELNIIITMGYADYLCIVEDFLRYGRAAGKLNLRDPKEIEIARTFDIETIENYTKDRPGEYIGPGRGSAAGSVVCYAIGITNVEPLQYNLIFERFLNPERVSMPDIDSDIESNVRPYVIEYVKHKYGENSVCGIMTKGTLKAKAAINNAAKVLAVKNGYKSTMYNNYASEIADALLILSDNDELHMSINKKYDELMSQFKNNPVYQDIIHYSAVVEGVITQYGMHAAGIVITNGQPVTDFIPLVYNEKNNIMATQCDMVQVEANGLLKMDFLGLQSLSSISLTLETIKEKYGITIDLNKIDYNDKEVYKDIMSKGLTTTIFQFESEGMKTFLQQLKPTCIEDIIAGVALYRPGPMDFIPKYIQGKENPETITYDCPQMKPILENTYGCIVYQEQVMQIVRDLAGYSMGRSDLVRRAMSKKKTAVMEEERKNFVYGNEKEGIKGCINNGISEAVANHIYDEMIDFAKYAFNKSHAACYAVVAFQSAYLKHYYTKEYMVGNLNCITDVGKLDKIPNMLDDLETFGIKCLQPDINKSDVWFTEEGNNIRYGLSAIKGIGASSDPVVLERKANGEFKSLNDFVARALPDKTMMETFNTVGAFDSFYNNRAAISKITPELLKAVSSIKKINKKISECGSYVTKQKQEEKKEEILRSLNLIQPDTDIEENIIDRLFAEKDILSKFISQNPLDLYKSSKEIGGTDISDAKTFMDRTPVKIVGMITDLATINTKKNETMCFFTVQDKTGTMKVSCFPRQYALLNKAIKDNMVALIDCTVSTYKDEKQLILENFGDAEERRNEVLLYTKDIDTWMTKDYKLCHFHSTKNGLHLRVFFEMDGEMRDTDLAVSKSILGDKKLNVKLVNS